MSSEQRAESREQRAESREQRAESREQRLYSKDQIHVLTCVGYNLDHHVLNPVPQIVDLPLQEPLLVLGPHGLAAGLTYLTMR